MAVCAPRSSVFTFESAVHSSHVLGRLDEQRRRDTLCDVTVVVEGQSFRAHRSVLASCSEYFSQRISSLAQHAAVVTLPLEVTTAGFEPLLKFAYTSKLLFGKDNVLDIRNSASVLGFRDLDEACFDFLLPKLLSSSEGAAPFQRKTCCKKKCKKGISKEEERDTDSDHVSLDEKEVKPVADSPLQQEAVWVCNTSVNKAGGLNSAGSITPAAEETNELFMQCPKYRKFQLACGKESCLTEKSLNNPVTANRNDCNFLCSPSSSNTNHKNESELPENSTSNPSRQSKCVADDPRKSEIPDRKTEAGACKREVDMVNKETNERQGKWSEKEEDMDLEENGSFLDRFSVKASSSEVGEVSSGSFMSHQCPLKTFGDGLGFSGSPGHKGFVLDCTEDKKMKEKSVHCKTDEEAEWKREKAGEERGRGGQTGIIEKTVAEQSSRLNLQDPNPSDAAEERGQSASSEWLHGNLSSTGTSCPFFQNLEQRKCVWKGAELSECEGASQSGVSSLNSGEDGDSGTETEGDSEFYERERARQVQLPFSVDWIVDLSRNDFQQLLKQQVFTREQLDFVHDMRRRSKNRLAAQRCRKRKLDCIYNLQCEINKLKTEREKLMMEKSHLSQLKMKTCHSVSALCQRVCSEADLKPEQLQVLAKYSSPDCPLSSVYPQVDSFLSQPDVAHQLQASLSARAVGPDDCLVSEEASCSSGGDAVTGDGQHSL